MGDPRYGNEHQKLRAEWKQRIDAGEVVHCCHEIATGGREACLEPDTRIYPGTRWNLGHRMDEPTLYAGPEHERCNKGTSRIWKRLATTANQVTWMP